MFDPQKMPSTALTAWHAQTTAANGKSYGGLANSEGWTPFVAIDHGVALDPGFAEFVAIAHNERLIMDRRRWFVMPLRDIWVVFERGTNFANDPMAVRREDGTCFTGQHPIGLLTEADEYFRERGK